MNTFLILAGLSLLIFFAHQQRRKRAKNKVIGIIDNNCTGCRRCVKRCRRQALTTVKDETGIHIIVTDPGKCTACKDCIAVCKFNALELIDREDSMSKVFE